MNASESAPENHSVEAMSAHQWPWPPFSIDMAPPFTGWTGIRSPTPWGFWSAVRTDAGNGMVVMQLGRRQDGNARYTRGRLEVGWKKRVQAVGGTRFRVTFAARPVTLKPNGGSVSATIALVLRRVSDGRYFSAFARPVSYRTYILEVEAPTSAYYDLQVTGILNSFYWGSANPYGEIIGHFTDVERIIDRPILDPDDVPQLAALTTGAAGLAEDDDPATADEKAFELSEKYIEREVGDDPQAVALAGLIEFAD